MGTNNSETGRASFQNEVPTYLLEAIERAAKYCEKRHVSSGLTYHDFYSIGYMAVLKALPQYVEERGSIAGFCWKVAVCEAHDQVRAFTRSNSAYYRATQYKELKDFFEEPELIVWDVQDATLGMQELVAILFRKLSTRDQAIASRYWIKEESARAISKRLNITQAHVEYRIDVLRKLLRARAEEYVNV